MLKEFAYSSKIVDQFPNLQSLVVIVENVTHSVDVSECVNRNIFLAKDKLASVESESHLDSIQSWRRAYRMTGADPTKYRCAPESILRRLRTNGDFPVLHPLVTLCNSFCALYALPIAALDRDEIDGDLTVQYTTGGEKFLAFDRSEIILDVGEVTFKDFSGHAHARKWSHKQSLKSAISNSTCKAIIFAEAVHKNAGADLFNLKISITEIINSYWANANVNSFILKNEELIAGIKFIN